MYNLERRETLVIGDGDFRYERIAEWGKVPEYFIMDDPVDLDIDSRDRVFVGSRGNHPVIIFDRDGDFISCWGEGHLVDPHGIIIAGDDSVFVTDSQTHTVEKRSPAGDLLLTIGTRFRCSAIVACRPFNMPTGLAIGPSGDLFVCDGYGNFLIHKFSPQGELIKTWGGIGDEPGQFALPHKIDVDGQGTLYVCDRNNNRIQLFTPDGEFIEMWTDYSWPQDIFVDQRNELIYVVESQIKPPLRPRVSIRDMKGKIIVSWEGEECQGKGVLASGHSICVDSHGDIYVGDIVREKRIQKFVRVR